MRKRKHPQSKQVTIVPCMRCVCADCGKEWTSTKDDLPLYCTFCKSSRWHIPKDERKKPGRPAKEKG